MKRIFHWSHWRIGTKILLLFLGLSVLSMGVLGAFAIVNLRDLGNYAVDTSSDLGERAIYNSTEHLNKLGEQLVNQKAIDVAKQVEMYLETKPSRTIQEMRNDADLHQIVVQLVGTSGYTTLIDPVSKVIIIHKFPEKEQSLTSLIGSIPSFWALLESSIDQQHVSGYYDWIEIDGSNTHKYASIVAVNHRELPHLTLWATTYINEFSQPAVETEKQIVEAISDSRAHINEIVTRLRDWFLVIFTALVIVVISIALLLARLITSPVHALKQGAEEISRGNLDYKIQVNSGDELGQLASAFNNMSTALSEEKDKAKKSADENIEKERKIQENLRLYLQKISEAQETERKRIARELHDQTVQDLIVVIRQLDDYSSGNPEISIQQIRSEIQKILQEVRSFGQELRPSVLDDLGLIPAVKWLASLLNKEQIITVETVFTGDNRQLSPVVELMLFRIIQEALTNVRKHSKAANVLVKMDFSDQSVNILVSDDGAGFSMPSRTADFTRLGKLGLVGMEERVQLIGGKMVIESQPNHGVTIRISVPV